MFVVNLHVWMSHLLGPTIGLAAIQMGRGNLPFVPHVCAVTLSPCFRLAPCSRNSYLSVWEQHSQEDAFQRRIGGSPDSDSFTVAQRKCSTRRMLEQETILFCLIWDLKQGKQGVEERTLSNLDWGFSVTRDCRLQQMEMVKFNCMQMSDRVQTNGNVFVCASNFLANSSISWSFMIASWPHSPLS